MADRVPSTPPRPPRHSGVIVPHEPMWHQRLAAWMVFLLARAVGATIRFRFDDPTGVLGQPRIPQSIFCIWHNRLALCLEIYRRVVKRRYADRRLAAVVSASKDGALLACVLRLFQVEPVRGSSSRRGPQALLELTGWAERGLDLAITPDGPRGPRHVVQEGVVALAQLTGLTVVPASYRLSSKVVAKSWDRFQIPLPFARCDVRIGEPMRIARETSAAEREAFRLRLERELRAITDD